MNSEILNKEIILKFAGGDGLRTFAYAYKDMNSDRWEQLQAAYNNFKNETDREIIVSDLTFVAGFGLEDPLRENVGDSIKKLTDSGVNVRMISGDNLYTATRSAVRANIISEN
jgi:P-type E1-E2 ATPase